MKKKTVLGLVLMGGFAALLFMNFGEQVGGYMNFTQAVETGSRAHVVGEWVKEQHYQYDPGENQFSFMMKDSEGSMKRVIYKNPKPANFEDAESVVVEGKMNGDVFEAEYILVKCPSKYNDTKGPTS
jgi:cytochrome c-type biogenesis protein CcmE